MKSSWRNGEWRAPWTRKTWSFASSERNCKSEGKTRRFYLVRWDQSYQFADSETVPWNSLGCRIVENKGCTLCSVKSDLSALFAFNPATIISTEKIHVSFYVWQLHSGWSLNSKAFGRRACSKSRHCSLHNYTGKKEAGRRGKAFSWVVKVDRSVKTRSEERGF